MACVSKIFLGKLLEDAKQCNGDLSQAKIIPYHRGHRDHKERGIFLPKSGGFFYGRRSFPLQVLLQRASIFLCVLCALCGLILRSFFGEQEERMDG